ncbi:penicillin-binding protein 2 [Gallaecimonas sp. GXIMD4217]|uniref:penicillin-binding protein 2 n=1 Tax=Gallaecimonas sp. GXIMD4217 TaxID=3131927 RepID=UPI00311B326B
MGPRRVAIRDHGFESSLFWRRALFCLAVVVLLLGALLANLYRIQVQDHQIYQTRSNDNRIKLVPVAPNRGIIYDRNGVVLAENRPVFSLEVIPEQVQDLDQSLAELSALLGLEQDDIDDFRKAMKGVRRFKRIPLLGKLSEEQVAVFAVNQHRFPGVSVEARLKRYYPFKDKLTHALGYVARINDRDLKRLDEKGLTQQYAATHEIGKLGIERYYEDSLHGKVGFMEVEVNNRGRVIRTLRFQPPEPGQDLYLNIDINLQLKAQELLAGQRGSIIALDPKDGGVLALASSPSYDPNLFVRGISSKNYNALLHSPDRPLINRATRGRYPPASTVKPLLALVGLEEGVISPHSKVWDPGFFQLPNVDHKYRDWKPWGHGWVDLKRAIAESCDTYFYQLAMDLGIDKISQWMTRFGFGEYTGIDIHEEISALMPSRQWKRARLNRPWYGGETVIIGIGQSYWTVTPLQLATATTTLANRGTYHTPRLLRAYGGTSGILPLPPEDRDAIVLDNPVYWQDVLDAMHRTNSHITGSGYKAFKDAPYSSAGKTGTAQVAGIAQDAKYEAEKVAEHLRDNAMYVGFAPFEDPQIVVSVALENVIGGGSKRAAPLAREMMDAYLVDDGNQGGEGSHE